MYRYTCMSNSIYLHCSAVFKVLCLSIWEKNGQLSHDCTNSSVDSDLEIISLSVTCTSFLIILIMIYHRE